jgi:signal transduction histidine kinase
VPEWDNDLLNPEDPIDVVPNSNSVDRPSGMNHTLRLHLVSMALYVAVVGTLFWVVQPTVFSAGWWIALVLQVAFLMAWIALLFRWSRTEKPAVLYYQVDFSLGLTVQWLGHAAVIPALAALLPIADEAVRLMIVISLMGPILTAILGTFEGSDDKGHHELLPFVMPVALAVIFSLIGGRFMLPVVASMGGIILLSLLLRGGVKKLFERVRRAKREAETQRDAKTRFLASASHDLGQPLQAARMFFDQAMRGDVGEKRDKAVRGVHWAFDASEQLLGQMMAHLQLESGVVEPQLQPLVIGPLIAEVADMNEPAAGLAGVSLHAMPSGLKVLADAALVERALGNLIGNAIRHAKARRILIGARAHQGRVRIWVIDDGTGIAPADIPRLFEDYVQGSDHGEEIRGGFGLGLATTRRLARLMGGDAGLEAKWVNGSAFWLDLPAA